MHRALLALAACAVAQSSQALVIDDFSDGFAGGALVTVPGGGTASTPAPDALTALAFEQRTAVLETPVGTPGLSESTLDIVTGPDVLTFINDPDTTSSGFTLAYGNDVAPFTDLTAGGNNFIFEFDVSFSDVSSPQSALFIIEVEDEDGDSSVAAIGVGLAGTYAITFAAFSNAIDFDRIDNLFLQVDASGVDAPDIIIDEFRAAVPEPATYAAFFGIAALGLALLRRRLTR